MGVYYEVQLGFGFPAPDAPEGEYDWEWQEENVPQGFSFITGGDLMNGTNQATLYGLPNHIKEIFWSGRDGGFGVHKVDGFIEVTDEEREQVIQAARELGVDDRDVGYYVISSVG